jgi:uncharacterized protein YodC (DUF2158 family)
MNEIKVGDVVMVKGAKFVITEADPSDGSRLYIDGMQASLPAPECNWVEREVRKHHGWNEWVFDDPSSGTPEVLCGAVNIPGFGGVLYDGCSVWCATPAYVRDKDENSKPRNPVKVRFWREVL